MNRLSKTLLAVCVLLLTAGVVISSIGGPVAPVLTLALPLGAVFYGLFLINRVFQDELRRFDESERSRLGSTARSDQHALRPQSEHRRHWFHPRHA
jgi:hypothetical protein